MTYPELLRKWLPYVAILLSLFAVESMVLPQLSPLLPCLLPLLVGVMGVLEGPTTGAAFGLCAGFLFSLQTPGMEGLFLFPLALLGALSGVMTQHWGLATLPACLVGGLGTLFVLDLLRIFYFAFVKEQPLLPLFTMAGLEILLSALCLPLVYGLCHLARGHQSKLPRRRF